MHRRIVTSISFMIVLLFTILIPTTADAATVVRRYDLTESPTDYTRGLVYFYNRSAEVVGDQEAENDSGHACRYTKATTDLGSYKYSSVVCNGSSGYDLIIPADVVGGASSVKIDFYLSEGSRSLLLGSRTVYRAHE